jgi:transposase-like protein
LVDLVRTRPGITVREAATELGVDPTGLYRVVHRLEERGALRKHGPMPRLEAPSGSANVTEADDAGRHRPRELRRLDRQRVSSGSR